MERIEVVRSIDEEYLMKELLEGNKICPEDDCEEHCFCLASDG